ncbi:hypothetical protein PV04_02087 [Phialophora macrospora]|uniref:Bacteriophage T5 Orf172 DNA-binding domain-containing protein n=1 Tax=Phialophora macrospora TaxID=1851006 RepID=A0A0D2EI71_9EURO|nr:hypothetical protein PV04_02087 [Phialophora macrospora]
MAHIEIADNFPAPQAINLSAEKIRCSYWLTDRKRHCSRPVKMDPDAARKLQKNLADIHRAKSPPTSDLCSSVIEDLLERSCCWQHKTKLHYGTLLGGEVRRRWRDQLNAVKSERTAVGTTLAASSSAVNDRPGICRVETSAARQTVPRQNLRSGRHVAHPEPGREDDVAHTPAPDFLPMQKPGRTVAQKLLRGPTSEQLRRTRDLYAYGRKSSPGMLKIGVSVNVEARLEDWSRSCLYRPILKHHLKNVPCAQLVEGLTHSELLPFWRREIRCKHNPDCPTQHKEWFEVDDAVAFRVMDNWVKWIRLAKPYDGEGHLEPIWRSRIEDMEASGIPVTSQRLLDVFESSQRTSTARTDDALATRTGRTVLTVSSVDEAPKTSVDATRPAPVVVDVANTATVLSAIADIISSLSASQKCQLQGLLEERTPQRAFSSLPRSTRLVPAV